MTEDKTGWPIEHFSGHRFLEKRLECLDCGAKREVFANEYGFAYKYPENDCPAMCGG